jgi:GntR family transcriptional regulator
MGVSDRRSLRHRLADDLREQVLSGEYRPGAQLPSEPELARTLSVSRASIRAAITLLEQEGLLRRQHGSGTYVTNKPLLRNDLSRNFSVSAMIAATGLEPGTRLARARSEPAPDEVAAAFEIPSSTPISVLRRVRTANGKRVVDTTDWCRSDVLDPATLSELAGGSIYGALAERGLSIHHGVASISPTAAGDEIARRLRVAAGTLLLTLFQVDRTAEGEVVLVSREHHLADAFDISVYRRGPRDSGEDEV